MNEASTYHYGTRYPFSTITHYNGTVQDHYRLPPSIQAPIKQDEYAQVTHDDGLVGSGANLFLGIPGASTNPLFSQDRLFLNSYSNEATHHQPVSPLGFTAINRSRERSYSATRDQEPRHQPATNIKLEPHVYDTIQNDWHADVKEDGFNPKSIWSGPGSENDLATHDDLQSEAFEM